MVSLQNLIISNIILINKLKRGRMILLTDNSSTGDMFREFSRLYSDI